MATGKDALEILCKKLQEHSRLDDDDTSEVRRLTPTIRTLNTSEDIIRQGDRPKMCVLVVHGMVARYHILANGRRQYLSFHFAGDMPDSQGLFIDHMDHAVCAVGRTIIAMIGHSELMAAFARRPSFSFAIWRETLIDAAIFREAITNNSSRSTTARMAHLFSEIFYRSSASGLVKQRACPVPISLIQLGEALGMSLATVNRALSKLRREGLADLKDGSLIVNNQAALARHGDFDHRYLHLRKLPRFN
jgi:CRP-like cAMP-binding protein